MALTRARKPRRGLRSAFLPAITVTLAVFGCEPPDPPPPADPPARPLPSSVLRDDLEPGAVHRFEIDLDAGDLLDVRVIQRGIDLELRISDSGRRELALVDGPYGDRGTERALVEVHAPGPAIVAIQPTEGTTAGSYELLADHRPVTDADRLVLEAARAHAQGEHARRARNWAGAADAFGRAAELWRVAGDGTGEALSLHRLGRVRKEQDDLAGALAAYLAARGAAAAGDDGEELRVMRADLALGIGRLRMEMGDLEGAAADLLAASALYAELGDLWRQGAAANEAAGALEQQGNLDAARRSYGEAVELARRADDPRRQGSYLNNLGELHLRLGRNDLAVDVFAEALSLRRETGDLRGEGITLASRGTAERRLGRSDEALQSFAAALDRLSGEDDWLWRAIALVGEGLTELQIAARKHKGGGHLDRAEEAFSSALDLLRGQGQRRSQALVLLNLAEVDLTRADGESARARAEEALAHFDALGDRQSQASAYFTIARAERLRGHPEIAYRFNVQAVERMESVRERAGPDPLRISYLAFRREYYEHAVDLAVELAAGLGPDWVARAVEMSERGRARGLLDALLVARADLRRRLDPELSARVEQAETRLIDLEVERIRLEPEGPSNAATRAALDAVARGLRRVALELAEARAALRDADPAIDGLMRPEPFDVNRFVRTHLEPGTVVLEISLGESRGHLFWIDATSVESYPLPGRDRLDPLARLAHEALQESQKPLAAGRAERALRELSELVLGPLAHRLEGQRLLVVTDGALQYVPFGVLPDPRHLDAGTLLLARHEIVSLPSASVLEALRRPQPRPRAAKTVAVLADPVFSLDDPRLAAVADAVALPEPRRDDLRRLPFTAQEAAAILGLLDDGDGLAVHGLDANLDFVSSGALADYRILHIATHGRLHAEHPELSGLELSRYDGRGRPRPGTLYAHQIYDLPLGADLVVLSACRTALGREIRGEGLVGLTRGFFYAGASRVVVSLWSVDDRATTELMVRFYRHLLDGARAPAAALRAAQLELRSDPRWAAPYYWAGFVVQGDWR
jgi:CHAT domain-containing protein